MLTTNFRMRVLSSSVSLFAVVAALAAATGVSHAQTAATPAATGGAETITVTGYRSSLEKALDLKRKSDNSIDAIYAEDIAKFPELNLGDAIARVPGVSLQKEGGEGRNISVRGLGPNFTRILVNGMEAQATNTSPDNIGGVDRNRQFDFNTFAPDLFNQIIVAKTQSASTEEGSLGATVYLNMAHALDDPGLHFAANFKEGYNDLAKTYNPRGSFIFSDSFWDDKIGVVVSGSMTNRKYQDDGISNVREGSNFETSPGFASVANLSFLDHNGNPTASGLCDNVSAPSAAACADAAVKPRFAGRLDEWAEDQHRRSGAISLQFKPYDGTLFTMDAFTADFEVERTESNLEAPAFGTGSACTTGTGATLASPNNAQSSCGVAQIAMLSGVIQDTGAPSFYSGAPPATSASSPQTGVPTGTSLVAGKDLYQIVSGTFNNVDVRSEQRYDQYHTRVNQVTLKFDQKITDKVNFDALAGYSQSHFRQPVYALLIWDQFNVQGFSYNYGSLLNRVPQVNWGNAGLTNPNDWVLDQIRLRPSSTDNSFQNYQANLHWDAWDFLKFSAGVDMKRYSFTTLQFSRAGAVPNGQVYPITPVPTAGNPFTGTTTFFSSGTNCATQAITANAESCVPATVGSINPASLGIAGVANSSYAHIVNFNTRGITTPPGNVVAWVGPDVKTAIAVMGLMDPSKFPVSQLAMLGSNQNVDEKDTGGYFQGDFSTTFYGVPMHGNIGVRYVKTQQFAASPGLVNNVLDWQGAGRSYSDVLPSANIVFEPADNFLIRLAAAKVMVRPNLGSLVGTSLSVAGSTRSITIGNAGLNPFLAKDYDIGFEWYYHKGALLGLGLFYKDLTSTIQSFSSSIPVQGNPFGITNQQAIDACGATVGCSPTVNWTFNESVNVPGGQVDGFELNWQQPFDFLPSFLSNFGVTGNYTYVQSSVPVPFFSSLNSSGQPVFTYPIKLDLPNLSRRNYNWTLYYDDGTIEARVSAAHRSRYLNRVPSQVQQGDFDGINGTTSVDASFTYALNKHLMLTAEGVNLTDEYVDQFNGSADLPYVYHHTGREFFLGARYSY